MPFTGGFQHGKGEVFVTIDSDSNVDPQTIRHLVSPFVHDAQVGAVAGNVRILNRKEGIIPKMLEVSLCLQLRFPPGRTKCDQLSLVHPRRPFRLPEECGPERFVGMGQSKIHGKIRKHRRRPGNDQPDSQKRLSCALSEGSHGIYHLSDNDRQAVENVFTMGQKQYPVKPL